MTASQILIEDPLVQGWKKSLPLDAIDEELRDLVLVMNMLPGIRTTSCCIGHPTPGQVEPKWGPADVFFEVHPGTNIGLFILTRSADHRYWRFGCGWSIDLVVSDDMSEDGLLPLSYRLQSTFLWGRRALVTLQEEHAIVTARSLVANIWLHTASDYAAKFLAHYGLPTPPFWRAIWPEAVRGPLTDAEQLTEERIASQINARFFSDEP